MASNMAGSGTVGITRSLSAISPPLGTTFLNAGFILRHLSPLLAKTPLTQLQAHILPAQQPQWKEPFLIPAKVPGLTPIGLTWAMCSSLTCSPGLPHQPGSHASL